MATTATEQTGAVQLGRELGGGTFGVVHAGTLRDGRRVALKKIRSAGEGGGPAIPTGAFREVQALWRVLGPHANVVRVLDVHASGGCLCLVMERADLDLKQALEGGRVEERMAKYVLREAARGLAHCHARGVMHRDIKPSNILIWYGGQVKLADFGLARTMRAPRDPPEGRRRPRLLSHQVATRWYRAPELLFGSRTYDEKVDLWALGVVAIEMLLGYAPFAGDNDIDQIYRVMQVLGSPSAALLEGEFGRLPDAGKVSFPEMAPAEGFFDSAGASSALLRSARDMLEYSAAARPSAKELLARDVFFEPPLPCFVLPAKAMAGDAA